MAIAFDATAGSSSTSNSSTLTYSHTCTGTNLILFVGITFGSSSDTVSGVTYNGVSMTRAIRSQDFFNQSNYLYELIAPTTGSHSVVVTYNTTNIPTSVASVSYTGARQSTQPEATSHSGTGSSSVNNYSQSITTVSGRAWGAMFTGSTVAGSSFGITAGTGTTLRKNQTDGNTSANFLDAGVEQTLPASVTLNQTNTSAQGVGAIGFSIAHSPEAFTYSVDETQSFAENFTFVRGAPPYIGGDTTTLTESSSSTAPLSTWTRPSKSGDGWTTPSKS